MHRLARHIAVNECLGKAFGQVGGGVQGAEPGREGDRTGALGAERDPDVPPADLVAGALHQQPARGQACAQPPPDRGHLVLVVLPQHVRRPDEDRCPAARARQRHLEAAVQEVQPRPAVRAGRLDPRRVDLDADHAGVRPDGAQPAQQLHRGPGRGAVAEVDRDRVGGAAQCGAVFGGYPAVHAAQPVGVGGAPGGVADGPGRRGGDGRGAAGHGFESMGSAAGPRIRAPAPGHALAKYPYGAPYGNGWPGSVVAGVRGVPAPVGGSST